MENKKIAINQEGKKFTAFHEGEFEIVEKPEIELSMEALVNLGNFSSVKLISKRAGNDRSKLVKEILEDLQELKKEFLVKYEELYG